MKSKSVRLLICRSRAVNHRRQDLVGVCSKCITIRALTDIADRLQRADSEVLGAAAFKNKGCQAIK